ncbi:MAG: DUF2284 domain-containing protein [Eubacteriaceae bacterium]|nr:DUF2284 domain-containing protein [Eubacteriaceae bacterium]
MSLEERIILAIEEIGFDEYVKIPTTEIIFSDAVFAQCAKNICGNYGQNHSCPPRSGTREENAARFLKYENAIVLNKLVTLGRRYEIMDESGQTPRSMLEELREKLKGEEARVAGGGGCRICPECSAKTDEPCLYPDERQYSMEGSGMDIVSLSRKLKMTYNAGNNRLGFFSIVLY